MKKIAIIPLKSDSKRFPRKNFKLIDGKSLLMNTIDKLYEAGVDMIIISTDIEEEVFHMITPTARFIFIYNRPENLMGDAKTEQVVMDIINETETNSLSLLKDYTIVLTQVTSPLWKPHRLKFAIEKLKHDGIDSVVSVSPDYSPNGCFYVFNKNTFLKHNKFFTNNTYLVSLPWKESIDIDYEHELSIANALSKDNYV